MRTSVWPPRLGGRFTELSSHTSLRITHFSTNLVAPTKFSNRRTLLRRWLPVIPIACGISLMASGIDTGRQQESLRHILAQADSWAPLLFVIIAVLALTVLIPKTAVSLTAGALFGTAAGCLLMLLVAVTAAAINYAIGRWWLHAKVDRALDARGRGTWTRAVRDMAAEAGCGFHFLLRLTPLPTAVISYAMGASGSRFFPFLVGAAGSIIPQSLWVHGGTAVTAAGETGAGPLRWLGIVVSVVAAIAIGIVVPPLAMRRIEAMNQLALEGTIE